MSDPIPDNEPVHRADLDEVANREPPLQILFGGYQQEWQKANLFDILDAAGVAYERHYAEGRWCDGHLDDLAARIIGRNPQVILAVDTPSTVAACEATRDVGRDTGPNQIIVVTMTCGNPWHTTLTNNVTRLVDVPNLVGFSDHTNDKDSPLRLKMLHEFLNINDRLKGTARDLPQVAVVWNRSNRGKARERDLTLGVANALVPLVEVVDFGVECNRANWNFDALFAFLDNLPRLVALLIIEEPQILQFARHILDRYVSGRRLPTMWESTLIMAQFPRTPHGLVCFGPPRPDVFRAGAALAIDKLARPGVPPDPAHRFTPTTAELQLSYSGAAITGMTTIPGSLQGVPFTRYFW